jgi:hypothetical protein
VKLSDLKPAEYNPREITDDALLGLGYSIEEFGDVSGIVINKRTGNLVSGHQRVKALQDKYGDLKITRINNEVVKDASVIVTPENIFLIREVDWPIEKEKAANLAANNSHISGDFTPELADILGEIKANSPELYERLQFEPLELDVPLVEIDSPGGGGIDGDNGEKMITCPECGVEFKK